MAKISTIQKEYNKTKRLMNKLAFIEKELKFCLDYAESCGMSWEDVAGDIYTAECCTLSAMGSVKSYLIMLESVVDYHG